MDSLPLNFLNPIPGTPLRGFPPPAAFRGAAGGRAHAASASGTGRAHLRRALQDVGQWQSWVFAAGANGVMTGNYLTTKGCAFCDDAEMYEVLGLREERS